MNILSIAHLKLKKCIERQSGYREEVRNGVEKSVKRSRFRNGTYFDLSGDRLFLFLFFGNEKKEKLHLLLNN